MKKLILVAIIMVSLTSCKFTSNITDSETLALRDQNEVLKEQNVILKEHNEILKEQNKLLTKIANK